MKTYTEKTKQNNNQSVANTTPRERNNSPSPQLLSNQSATPVQTKMQEMANNSPQVRQMKMLQKMTNKTSTLNSLIPAVTLSPNRFPVQLKKWRDVKEDEKSTLVTSLQQYIAMGLLKVDPVNATEIPATPTNIACLEAILGEAAVDTEMPLAREALAIAAGFRLVKPAIVIEAMKINAMKRAAFAGILTGSLGCTSEGKDGQNHDIYKNPKNNKTTSLGIGGHGDPTQDAGTLKIYLGQLGISASEWNKANE